jgi:hypothetical protein
VLILNAVVIHTILLFEDERLLEGISPTNRIGYTSGVGAAIKDAAQLSSEPDDTHVVGLSWPPAAAKTSMSIALPPDHRIWNPA